MLRVKAIWVSKTNKTFFKNSLSHITIYNIV